MKNIDIFEAYDMVVSIPQDTINDQLNHLVRIGVIQPELILVQTIKDGNYVYEVLDSASKIPVDDSGNPEYAYVNGEILPQVAISESGTNITFILKFQSGTAYFWEGQGPLAQLKKFDMTGWQYGIDVDMDLTEIAKDDIGKNVAVPKNVEDQLKNFSDDMFTINHLFMDFESTNLLKFNPTQSNAGSAGEVGLQYLVTFMQFYLENLIKSGNPYILGYSLTTNSQTNYPENQKIPDSLRPVGTTYTMYYDPAHPKISNLNFVLTTQGGRQGILGSPGNFDSNWIQPDEQIDAKMIYSHAVLIEHLYLEPFFNQLRQGVYNKIAGDIDVGIGNSYQNAKSPTPSGFSYVISNDSSGDDQYVNKFEANIVTTPGQVEINLDGSLKFYKEHSQHMGFCTARASLTASVDWSGAITITVEKDKNGVPTLSNKREFRIDNSNQNTHRNECAKVASVFGDIFGKLLNILTLDLSHGFFSKLFDDLLNIQVPGIGNIGLALQNLGNSVATVIVLPAGQVFFFKNPSADPEANLSLGLTYKSET